MSIDDCRLPIAQCDPGDENDAHARDLECEVYEGRPLPGLARGLALTLAQEVIAQFEGSVVSMRPSAELLRGDGPIRVLEIEIDCVPYVGPERDANDMTKWHGDWQRRRVYELMELDVLDYRHASHPVVGERSQRLRYKGFPLTIHICTAVAGESYAS